MSRRSDLRTKAAAALREGDDPLHIAFLSKHGVTMDEAYDLADDMALGLDMVSESLDLVSSDSTISRQVGGQRVVEAILRGTGKKP